MRFIGFFFEIYEFSFWDLLDFMKFMEFIGQLYEIFTPRNKLCFCNWFGMYTCWVHHKNVWIF